MEKKNKTEYEYDCEIELSKLLRNVYQKIIDLIIEKSGSNHSDTPRGKYYWLYFGNADVFIRKYSGDNRCLSKLEKIEAYTHDDIGEIYVKTDSSYYHFAYLTVEEQVDILQYLENFYGKNK